MSARAKLIALLAGLLVATLAGAASPAAPDLALDIRLDPAARRIRAVAEFAASRESRFMLRRAFTVSSVSVDGRPAAVVPTARGADMREWRFTAPEGAKLRVEYGGTLPALDPELSDRDVLLALPPMTGVDGSFLPAGSGWYPQPGALFNYRVTLSLPGDQRGLVAGHLVRESLPHDTEGRYVATFEFEHPAEGIDLMAGPYIVRERLVPRRGGTPLRLRTYFYRSLDALSADYLDDSRRYLERYSTQIGPYPYSGFSVVASPLPTGFGMPALTYIGAQVLRLPFIRATSLGHEVLHNWWGNGVYVDYGKGNWSEGLTTFMADYFQKEQRSVAAARAMRLGWLRDFAAVPAGSHRSLAAFRSRTHGAEAAVGYSKSAMVFFMLRDAIGKDAFRRGIRLLWERYRFKLASWDDLRNVFGEVAGRSLKTFFDQWVQRAGGPVLRIAQARAHTENGKTTLALTFTQTSPAYTLRVPVEIVTGAHSETRWVDLDREHQTTTIDLDAAPDGVRLDPDFRLWRTLDPGELPPILRQWIIARAPRLAIVSADADAALAAWTLARRFFESPPKAIDLAEIDGGSEPVLIIGLQRDVDAALAKLGLPPRPPVVSIRGSAQIWTVRNRNGGSPFAVVSAADAASLTALLGPLPHYGAQSYLSFEGSRAIDRGIWPATARLIPVTR